MKRCYISYMANDRDIKGILVNNYLMKLYNCQYPYICLCCQKVSNQVKLQLMQHKIETVDIKFNENLKPYLKKDVIDYLRSKYYYGKFFIFLANYDECVYLDSDILILKNIDNLFDKLSGIPKEDKPIFMVPDILQQYKDKNIDPNDFNLIITTNTFNSGVIVFKPNHEVFIDIISLLSKFTLDQIKEYIKTDQNIFNRLHYLKSINIQKLEFEYNIIPRVIDKFIAENIVQEENISIIHYILQHKPWEDIYNRGYNNTTCKKYLMKWLSMYQLFVSDNLKQDNLKYHQILYQDNNM